MSYINKYNLLNASHHDNVAENTILFTTEYIFLLMHVDVKDAYVQKLKQDLIKYIDDNKVEEGLYNQLPDEIVEIEKDRYMSHDQLLAIIAFSKKFGLSYHKDIWNWLKTHWFTYDNVSRKTNINRIYRPEIIIYSALCANSIFGYLFFPYWFITRIVNIFHYYKVRNNVKILKSGGMLLTLVMCYGANLNWSLWLFTKLLKYRKVLTSWREVIQRYFPHSDHPMNMFSKLLDD
jgi:hypothetical protein